MRFNPIQDMLGQDNNFWDDAMHASICVDMHCHSSFSDGSLSVEQLVANLVDSGVKYASLTDHNTIAGLTAFKHELMQFGIGYVSGLEITTEHRGVDIHLLAYGYDEQSDELSALLHENDTNNDTAPRLLVQTFRNSAEIIDIIHRCGGLVLLAHPMQTQPDFDKLIKLIEELKKLGIDGIEALYGPNPPASEKKLLNIAAISNLLTSAGTDFHTPYGTAAGITITVRQWKSFRDALLKTSSNITENPNPPTPKISKRSDMQWFAFFKNIFLPALLSLVLFIVALFVFILPYFEETMIDRKRDNIRQLTQVAWGVLNEAAQEVENGQLSLEQAQTLAKNRIEAMRYGEENQDYFWLQDTTPRILMHPYRVDLNDQDVTDFTDAEGTRIFVAFSELVLAQGEGYISYVWQWMDDSQRLEPKESYIRLFEPWGWVIGTGIYVNDVKAEVDALRSKIVWISLGIVFLVTLLLLYQIRQGMLLERSRGEAEKLLLESTDRYKALSEAATEGALFIYDGRCRYANAVMYELLGCSPDKIELLDVQDVFPDVKANKEWLEAISVDSDGSSLGIYNGIVRRNDDTLISCDLTVKNGLNDPKSGFMVLVRRSADYTEHTGMHVALNRLLHISSSIASDLADSIKNAYNVNEVVNLCKKTSGFVLSLLDNGTSSIAIAYMISIISDLTMQKIIELTINEIGPPPTAYAFLALGSHGRQSQTLFSDQDNALIYRLSDDDDKEAASEYFLKLGSKVCDALELAGYHKCVGLKMASNPQWNQPSSVWKSYFREWILTSQPQQVVEFSIMFDLRAVSGDPELVTDLRRYIFSEIRETPFFLSQIAQNALLFKTPLRLFGNIMTSGGKSHPGRIDVKTPAMAIVTFARLYALKNEIEETNTLLQLDGIKSLGIILDSKHRDIVTSFETLLRLRLWNQALAISHNEELDNWVNPDQLGHLDEVLLIECFKEIDELQGLIQHDFLA